MSRAFTTFESNVLFALRFMIDHDVVGGNWVELPAGQYTFQGAGIDKGLSHCQLEAHIHCSKLISHKPEGEFGTERSLWHEDARTTTPEAEAYAAQVHTGSMIVARFVAAA